MPKRIRPASSTPESEQRQVRRLVEYLASRSDDFYVHVRNYAASLIGVTPQWLDHAIEKMRDIPFGRMVTADKTKASCSLTINRSSTV